MRRASLPVKASPNRLVPASTVSRLAAALIAVAVLAGCASRDPYRIPRDRRVLFEHLHPLEYAVPGHAKFLEGVKVCLDPGHGGDGHIPNYKRGPTGVREAEVNWRVAMELKEFLETSGADVILTREGDVEVGLAERAEIANRNQVDFFISMHHNAAGKEEVNYTSTWYHSEPDFAAPGLDLARNLHYAMSETLGMQQALANGLKSDYLIYPGSGFGVLRRLSVAGCLMESSFHSNPQEEQRLDTPWYNKREAYGYFLGICRYVAGGLPKIRLLSPLPGSRVPSKTPTVTLELSDGLRERGGWGSNRNWIHPDEIRLYMDEERVLDYDYDNQSGRLTFQPANELSNTRHRIRVGYRNVSGNHVLPHGLDFVIAPPVEDIKVIATPAALNADGFAYTRLDVELLDADGLAVADGTPFHMQADLGRLESEDLETFEGRAVTFLTAPREEGTIHLTAQTGGVTGSVAIPVKIGARSLVYAEVVDRRGAALDGVTVTIGDHTAATAGGRAILDMSRVRRLGTKTILAERPGYFKAEARVEVGRSASNFVTATLHPIVEGVLIDKVFIIDPRHGGHVPGITDTAGRRAADLNLAVALKLRDLLSAAGARVHLIRDTNTAMDVETRVRHANKIAAGQYLYIDHATYEQGKSDFAVTVYPSPSSRRRGATMIPAIASYLDMDGGKPENSQEPEIHNTKMLASGAVFRTLDHTRTELDAGDPSLAAREAYALFLAYAAVYKLPEESRNLLQIRVRDAQGSPIASAEVALDRTVTLLTGRAGIATFEGLAVRNYQVNVRHEGHRPAQIHAQSGDKTIVDVRLDSQSGG